MSHAELRTLRMRVRRLEHEAEIAARLTTFADGGPERERIYRFIASQSEHFPLSTLCRVCRVSRSAYYAWLQRGPGPGDDTLSQAHLANVIYDIWVKSKRRYGCPRITAALRGQGLTVNKKRVEALMAALGIAGISGRRKIRTTVRDQTRVPATDLVGRDFSAAGPDQLFVGDITYLPTDEGTLYVASVLDVFSRRLLGWSIASHLRTELCLDALALAAATRGTLRFGGTTLHTDHGCQYTSELFGDACRRMGITQSMGAVGNSYDNAMAESLWSSLKRELVDQEHFTTKVQARMAVFEWIIWYNRERLHSSLGYLSPEQFEESWRNQQAA